MQEIKDIIEKVKNQRNARVILMGDVMNLGSRDSIGGGVFDDIMFPEQQYDLAVELLTPIKNKIWGCIAGNHEENRMRTKTSFDLTKRLAKELDTSFCGYSSFFLVRFNGMSYVIYATHGSSGARLPYTKIKVCIDLDRYFEADLYLHAHLHLKDAHTGMFYKVNKQNKEVEEKERWFVLTGSFLDYEGSYAQAKNLSPSRSGTPEMTLFSDEHKIEVKVD